MERKIFDAHAHYDDAWFDEDRDELLKALPDEGVCGVVCNAVDLKSAEVLKGYSEKYPYIWFTAGFHPENLEDMPEDYLDGIKEYLKNEKCVAIGEIGLDYHWDIPRDLQKRVFEELAGNGVTFFTGVPDSYLNGFCNYALAHCAERNVIAANEGNRGYKARNEHKSGRSCDVQERAPQRGMCRRGTARQAPARDRRAVYGSRSVQRKAERQPKDYLCSGKNCRNPRYDRR